MTTASRQLPALILAAGRGERMRPLTDATPKPLLAVRGKPLIEWHLEALARDGVREVVINTAHLEEQFPASLGDGSRWGLRIRYSMEGRDHGGALETAGGIAKALPVLGDAFWVLAGDVFVPGFRFDPVAAQAFVDGEDWARIWLVPNPAHVPQGDFALNDAGRVLRKDLAPAGTPTGTYSTIGLYKPAMVAGVQVGEKAALRPSLERAIDANRLAGQWHTGPWVDVGTPQRLAELNAGSAPLRPGSHLTADLAGCALEHPWMTNAAVLREACLRAVAQTGLHAVGDCFHGFSPAPGQSVAGVTGVVLLAESHLAVHTWPEMGVVTLDVFVCNLLGDNAGRAQKLLDTLVEGFAPARQSLQAILRAMPEADKT